MRNLFKKRFVAKRKQRSEFLKFVRIFGERGLLVKLIETSTSFLNTEGELV